MLCVFPLVAALLGWALLALVRPDLLQDAIYPPPEWVTDPTRQRLRWLLAIIAGVLLVLALTPVVIVLFMVVREAPRVGVVLFGTLLTAASLAHQPLPGPRERPLGWLLVRGQRVRLLLLLAGLLLVGLAICLPCL